MNKMESKEMTPLVVIGVLIIVVFALMLILFSGDLHQFPQWLKKLTVSDGFSTLLGAFIGAYLAGRFAIASVNKQMDFMREQKALDDKEKSVRSLRLVSYELHLLLAHTVTLVEELELKQNFSGIKSSSRIINNNNQNFKRLLRDVNLTTSISRENFYHVYHIQNIISVFEVTNETIQLDVFEQHHQEVDALKETLSRQIEYLRKIQGHIKGELGNQTF